MNTSLNAASEQLTKLAEALYRFSHSLDSSFSIHLKELAVELAGALSAEDHDAVAGILARAKGVISLGEQVGAIAANDVQVISAAIARSRDLALPIPAKKAASVEVFAALAHGVESKVEAKEETKAVIEKVIDRAPVAAPAPVAPAIQPQAAPVQSVPVSSVTLNNPGTMTAADRQSRIIAAIRQNPSARMRDLLAELPGVSERTIRYDIERLVSSGMIEREGIGGPATWYRLREGVTR